MSPGRPLRVLHIAPTPFFSDRGCHIRIDGIVNALNRCDTPGSPHHGVFRQQSFHQR